VKVNADIPDPLAQVNALLRRQADARSRGQTLRLTPEERALLDATKPDRLKLARKTSLEKKFAAGARLSTDQLALIGVGDEAAAQDRLIPRPAANGLPVYDSMEQCGAAAGIPLLILKTAKRNGCSAFRSNRVFLGEFLAWHFTQENKDLINLQVEKARLARAEADLAERAVLASDEQVSNFEETLKHLSETIILPLRQFKANLVNAYALRCNPDHPEIARAALRQLETDLDKLLRSKLQKPKS
jgi:hypothetical protein